MKQVASLRYFVIFKKAFSQLDIFKAFVKNFLGIDLNKIQRIFELINGGQRRGRTRSGCPTLPLSGANLRVRPFALDIMG